MFKKCVPLHSLSGKIRKGHDDRGAFGTAGVFFCPVSRSSSLTDWNKVRNKTRQRGGGFNSALCILRYMWSDEIILNRKNGLREAWPDDRLFKYKRFYSEEFDPGSG